MKQANITKTNRIRITVSRKILSDYDLRVKIAGDINMRESTLKQAAYRNAKSLENYFLIESFKKHTSWTEDQIFESEQTNS